jgi:hypothetical protein
VVEDLAKVANQGVWLFRGGKLVVRSSDPIKSNLLSNESNKSDQTDQM